MSILSHRLVYWYRGTKVVLAYVTSSQLLESQECTPSIWFIHLRQWGQLKFPPATHEFSCGLTISNFWHSQTFQFCILDEVKWHSSGLFCLYLIILEEKAPFHMFAGHLGFLLYDYCNSYPLPNFQFCYLVFLGNMWKLSICLGY